MLTIKRFNLILNRNILKSSLATPIISTLTNNNNNFNNKICLFSSSTFKNNEILDNNYNYNNNNNDENSSPLFLKETIKAFKLKKEFIEKYSKKKAPFGFGVLGEIVYRRSYSRVKDDNTNEQWFETVERVVNGTYNIQRKWIERHGLEWNQSKAQKSAQEMYNRIFEMKFLPPGRGLYSCGSSTTESKGLFAALNNCAFVSTIDMKKNPSKPFIFLMDASMLGVGVGFDTKGEGSFIIKGQLQQQQQHHHHHHNISSSSSSSQLNSQSNLFIVPDSREGWVESVQLLLDSFFLKRSDPIFDYSSIRKKGEPIKGFGGVCCGYEPLKELHDEIRTLLNKHVGKSISSTNIVDLMNIIGKCVVAGNVRQAAEIAFGDPNSQEYINLKNYEINPHRASFGWCSNNSVFAELGMDYSKVCESIIHNGEPGFAWLDNMRKYSRMVPTELDNKDSRAMGGNPCLEQTLESYELCCLVETFPNNHNSLDDYLKTLKYAFLYAKTVTLGSTQWPDTNKVLLRNRRIGCSMSGIAQFIHFHGLHQLREWCTQGYQLLGQLDERYSEWLAIPKSIKKTSIKPSGTVSLLAGATPGMHYPISEYYIRRIRVQKDSDLIPPLIEAGYHVEPAFENKTNVVVEIPIHSGKGIRSANSITMWEQLSLAAFLQKYWADNQVSCTVSFDPIKEAPQLKHALDYFQYQLKGVSFLPNPINSSTPYKQMPYEEIDETRYNQIIANLKPVDFKMLNNSPLEPTPDKFCDSSSCTIVSDNSKTLNNL
ncbi:hypothetical protein RB653_003958 [Dictyostelium firmibasis]|uniref:ribonucleoside-triphosphate reductase (thioredoxin) n=1 Tax=Dictyostelium firmibasis TaxID=79012 RepID=A0AAN7U9S7_9MYCE